MSEPGIHARIEVAFERMGRTVVRLRWVAIVASLVLAASLIAQAPRITLVTAVESFLHPTDPARQLYQEFRDQFGSSELVMVAVRPPDVFDPAFLRVLRDMHEDLESEVPYLDEVQSLINARWTHGRRDELIVQDLMEDFDFSDADADAETLRERVLANPLYTDLLVSRNATFTAIIVSAQTYRGDAEADLIGGFDDSEAGDESAPRLTAVEMDEFCTAILGVVERYRDQGVPIWIGGQPILEASVRHAMQRDLRRFMGLMIAAIVVVLAVLFRRISGVVLPLVVVLLSIGSTIGAMAAVGAPIMLPTQVLPTFLLAVGTGAAVHILKIFFLHFDDGGSIEDSVAHAFGHSGLAVLMAGLTTAGGLMSFLAAGLQPLTHLGIFAPIGIVLALWNCLVLLPALLAVLPLRRRPAAGASQRGSWLERAICAGGDWSATHPRSVIAATLAIVAFSLPGALRLGFSNDVLHWLPATEPIVVATDLIDDEMRGSMTLEVVLDTGRENGVQDPAFLNGLERMRERSGEFRRGDYLFVGKTIAISDVLKEIHKALNENRDDFYAIPQDPRLVAQELLLFENSGSDDLEDVVDSQFQLARFTVKVPYLDPIRYDGFIAEVESAFQDELSDDVQVATTGFMGMMSRTIFHVIRGMGRSYLLALAIITPLMMALIGNLRGGLVSMVPNLTPILLTLGIMGWLGLSIDMFSLMIGGIAIGIAVDDTIHFIHGYRRYWARDGDARGAVRRTLESTGRALLVTSVVLSLSFLTFALSEMVNIFWFGVLTSFTIVSAFLIDILITPGLIVLFSRWRAAGA